MRELARSVTSFAWTLPLLGAQEGLRLLAGQGTPSLAGVAQLGHCFQGALVTMGPSLLTPRLLSPLAWLSAGEQMARRALDGLGQLPAAGAALAELRSKAQVFCLVLDVNEKIGVPPPHSATPFPLLELVGRAYGLDDYSALWAVEGLGHAYGDSFWSRGLTPEGILLPANAPDLPAKSLLMLHAGIGLSFAQHLLNGVGEAELDSRVAEIVRLCRGSSRPGAVGAAYESLGLVTRTFHAGLVPAVDRALARAAPELRGFYWHGVGRALYFLPVNFLPYSAGQVFAAARAEAPDAESRLSAVAGAAWAYALVGQRDPAILAELVVRPYGDELAGDGGFANGIASSTVMRLDTTPEADFLHRFFAYRPAEPAVARRWDLLVRRPGEDAIHRFHPVLKERGLLGEVFRYQDLEELAA